MKHPVDIPDPPPASSSDDLDDIYDALRRGAGRERVNDDNVQPLIERAARDGDEQLEALLREWRSPCGDDPDAPTLDAKLPPP